MIKDYKTLLLQDAIEFYCDEISDNTIVKGETWYDLKEKVMRSEDYRQETWFKDLSAHE